MGSAMRAIPFNVAEAVFEPFWDPQLSRLSDWQVDDGSRHGLEVRQFWCWVEFSWTRAPRSGPALSMQRSLDLDCGGYDRLLFSLVAPQGAEVAIAVETDAGERHCRERAPSLKREYAVDLDGAAHIRALRLEITALPDAGAGAGWFNWVGLQNRELLGRHLAAHRDRAGAMDHLLQPASVRPRLQPSLEVVITADELAAARRFHAAMIARGERSPFAETAARALATDPADLVNDVILTAPDTRYGREREHGVGCIGQAAAALQAAVVLEDAELLRRGAQFALAAALTPVWDWGFISRFPGSAFESRAFLQGLCSSDLGARARSGRRPPHRRGTGVAAAASGGGRHRCRQLLLLAARVHPSLQPVGAVLHGPSGRLRGTAAAIGRASHPIRSWRTGSCRRAWRTSF